MENFRAQPVTLVVIVPFDGTKQQQNSSVQYYLSEYNGKDARKEKNDQNIRSLNFPHVSCLVS